MSETPWWCKPSNVFHGVRHVGFKRNNMSIHNVFEKTTEFLSNIEKNIRTVWIAMTWFICFKKQNIYIYIRINVSWIFLILLFGFFTIQTGNFSNQFWSRGMFSTLFFRWKGVKQTTEKLLIRILLHSHKMMVGHKTAEASNFLRPWQQNTSHALNLHVLTFHPKQVSHFSHVYLTWSYRSGFPQQKQCPAPPVPLVTEEWIHLVKCENAHRPQRCPMDERMICWS